MKNFKALILFTFLLVLESHSVVYADVKAFQEYLTQIQKPQGQIIEVEVSDFQVDKAEVHFLLTERLQNGENRSYLNTYNVDTSELVESFEIKNNIHGLKYSFSPENLIIKLSGINKQGKEMLKIISRKTGLIWLNIVTAELIGAESIVLNKSAPFMIKAKSPLNSLIYGDNKYRYSIYEFSVFNATGKGLLPVYDDKKRLKAESRFIHINHKLNSGTERLNIDANATTSNDVVNGPEYLSDLAVYDDSLMIVRAGNIIASLTLKELIKMGLPEMDGVSPLAIGEDFVIVKPTIIALNHSHAFGEAMVIPRSEFKNPNHIIPKDFEVRAIIDDQCQKIF